MRPVALAPLGGAWSLWRSVCLRSAGFPADKVLALAASPVARAVDRMLAADAHAFKSRRDAGKMLHDRVIAAEPAQLERLQDARRNVRKGRPETGDGLDAEMVAILANVTAAADEFVAADRALNRLLETSVPEADAAIRAFATDETFRRAITWQNRRLLGEGIDRMLRHQGASDSQQRIRQRLVARYLQRYCLKNESIGAFGPIGWATLAEDGPAIDVRPGRALLDRREVYFEGWCIEALCEVIGRIDGIRMWIAPRVLPGIWIDGAVLRVPLLEAMVADGGLPAFMAEPRELAAADLDVIRACDGEQTITGIAERLNRDAESVADAVERLEASGVLMRRLEAPVDPHAERWLRMQVDRVQDATARTAALAILDEMEQARAAVAAADDHVMLGAAIEGLERTFTRITGDAATRAEGKTYAARTLTYEDCRRDVQVDLGPAFLAELEAPLGLILASARWLTADVARRYRAAFQEIYQAEAEKAGSAQVSLHAFSLRAQPLLGDADPAPLVAAADELVRRWAQVLGPVAEGGRRLQLRAADLAPRAAEAFAAADGGWALARYVSPDIMIAADGPDAIRRGDYQTVLGEVHLANTIGRFCLTEQHPDPAALMAARGRDIPGPCVIPVASTTWNVQRNGPALVQPDDVRFAYERPYAGGAGAPRMAIGESIVEQRDGALVVRTRDGRHAFDVIEFFGHTLSNQCLSYPRILAAAAHSPRVTVDRMVIAREAWRLSPADLPFVQAVTARDLMVEGRKTMTALGLPRWVFAKIPGEQKPYFVDFESPTYLKMFAQLVKSAAQSHGETCTIGVSEMLPSLDQLWLVDADGARYTSELRIVALDASSPSAHRTR